MEDRISGVGVLVSMLRDHNCPSCLWYNLVYKLGSTQIGRHVFGTWKLLVLSQMSVRILRFSILI